MKKNQAVKTKKSFLEKIILWGIVLIFAVLPLLYFPGRVASYVTSKQYFLIGTVDVLVILWVWLITIDKRYRLTKRNMFFLLPFLLFLVSLTVSAFVGVDTATSFFSTVESGTGLIVLYHVFLFACIIASVVRVQQKTILKSIFQANLFASAVLAIATFFTGADGLFNTHELMLNGSSGGAMMGNSLLAGAYFIFSIFLTIILIAEEQKTYKKIFYYLGIALIMLSPIYFNVSIWKGVPFSQLIHSGYFFIGEARVAFISLIIGLLISVFIWLALKKDHKVLRGIGIAAIIATIVVFVVAVKEIATPTTTANRFFVAQSGNRIIDWQEGMQGVKEKPLLGWGPENYHVIFQKFLNPAVFDPEHGNEVWALHPHNSTIEVLTNGGILGLLFYVVMLISLFAGITAARKKGAIDNKTFALLVGMLIAFILQQQMIYDSVVSYTMFFAIIGIVAGLSDTTKEIQHVYVDKNSYVIGTIIAVVMIPVWISLAYIPAQKMEEYQHVATDYSNLRTLEYQHLFHSAGSQAIDTDVEFYTGPIFYSYAAEEVQIKNNPVYQKAASQELQSLLTAVYPVWQQYPYDYHLTLTLVQLEDLYYYLTGDKNALAQADMYAKRAFVLSPTDPQIYINYAQTLVYENNIPEARIMVAKATSLNSYYQPAIDFEKSLQQQ
jgi:O-antigen ligase